MDFLAYQTHADIWESGTNNLEILTGGTQPLSSNEADQLDALFSRNLVDYYILICGLLVFSFFSWGVAEP